MCGFADKKTDAVKSITTIHGVCLPFYYARFRLIFEKHPYRTSANEYPPFFIHRRFLWPFFLWTCLL